MFFNILRSPRAMVQDMMAGNPVPTSPLSRPSLPPRESVSAPCSTRKVLFKLVQ